MKPCISRTAEMKKKINKAARVPFLFYITFFASLIFLQTKTATSKKNSTIPINVGVVLDMDRWIGKMALSCIDMALSDFYNSHDYYKTRIVLHNRDSKGDVVAAAAAALDLLKDAQVQAILGPLSSMQADFIINLGDKAHVPIISFSATSPSLSSIRSPYFVLAAQNDSSQVKAISSIVKAFQWREIVLIHVDNEFGEGIVPFLTDALDEINARIPYRSVIPPSATDDQIGLELYKLMAMQTRVFVVHMLADLGSRLFAKAKQLGMMSEGYAWITTDAITNELNSLNFSVIESMQGVIGVRPYVPSTEELESFTYRWKLKFQQNNPGAVNPHLNVFGLWAYDSATALAMAIEKAGVSNIDYDKLNISKNSTDLESFGVSRTGPKLLQAILSTAFKGLSGEFSIVGGQLQSPAYQIVNIFGNGAKQIGFWTAEKGIIRQLNFTNINIQRSSKPNFGAVIWPGDTVVAPKGWTLPANGTKLRVGVPVIKSFEQFVKVTKDAETNTTTVTGFCIDVFRAVMASLPYAVPYEFIPFATSNGNIAGNYNDLVYQVFLGIYDAVVGDVTITANRSQYVDFTLPYTDSGVSMIVPIVDNQSKNAWVFLKPLTWDLWLTCFLSFVFLGILIWVLEHRTNEEFRGPRLHQIGMIFWFSFSTMVFAQKERIVSNLARFVLIIWFLVVLTIMQSYTASLASMLTVQQLRPTITNVDELIKNKAYVGYSKHSFVFGLLISKGFDESRLLAYNSPEYLDELLTRGSGNGGIAAAFDETPYMKLFLATYCTKYTMVQPIAKTDGFGFVFPVGSPLLPDVSRAILNITGGDKMREIEKEWMLAASNCQDSSTSTSSSSLDIGSFWGLFLIVGIAAISSFIIYLTMFIHKHWYIVTNPNSSIWDKIAELSRLFDSKDLTSHAFRKHGTPVAAMADRDYGERTGEIEISPPPILHRSPVTVSLEASSGTIAPPSPCFSSHTEHSLNISGEHETPSYEGESLNQQGSTSQEITLVVELTSEQDISQKA